MSNRRLLSLSTAYRWLACPPSAIKNAHLEDKSSEYTTQDTEAHSLCAFKLKTALGLPCEDPRETLSFLDLEIEDCSTLYAKFVMDEKAKAELMCKDPLIMVEQKVDFSRFVPNGYGTVDCLIVSDQQLHVINFKYETGIQVETNNNPQMMCYALGAMLLYDGIYDIETVKMSIYQPKKSHANSWQISRQELYDWAVDVLYAGALMAAESSGELKAGDHCRFCQAKTTCRKRAE